MKKIIIITAVILTIVLLVTVFGGWFWFQTQLQAVDPANDQKVTFVIPKGQATSSIGQRLFDEGLIKNTFAFRFVVRQENLGGKIQSGSFKLSKSMSVKQIAQQLTVGTQDVWVTIPEGKRAEEIAELFSDVSSFDADEFLSLAKEDEGYLFPDTYLFPQQATAQLVHTTLTKRFDEVVKANKIEQKAKNQSRTLDEVVILASLLEREARTATEMKMVSGILDNRLKDGMALQVDATLQYVKTTKKMNGSWWAPALSADKELDSPYNTYKFPGLPPGAISNPGLKALQATVEPTSSDNYYYISDRDGREMYYAKTYDEHLENIEKYLK